MTGPCGVAPRQGSHGASLVRLGCGSGPPSPPPTPSSPWASASLSRAAFPSRGRPRARARIRLAFETIEAIQGRGTKGDPGRHGDEPLGHHRPEPTGCRGVLRLLAEKGTASVTVVEGGLTRSARYPASTWPAPCSPFCFTAPPGSPRSGGGTRRTARSRNGTPSRRVPGGCPMRTAGRSLLCRRPARAKDAHPATRSDT